MHAELKWFLLISRTLEYSSGFSLFLQKSLKMLNIGAQFFSESSFSEV